jgi:hypothetical protein
MTTKSSVGESIPAGKDMVITGKVIPTPYARGSKSEHIAVLIITDQGEYILRKTGDNPFENKALQPFLGKFIHAEGILIDTVFLAEKIWE